MTCFAFVMRYQDLMATTWGHLVIGAKRANIRVAEKDMNAYKRMVGVIKEMLQSIGDEEREKQFVALAMQHGLKQEWMSAKAPAGKKKRSLAELAEEAAWRQK